MDGEYLTVGEFSRTMAALRVQIATGFDETHKRQDKTNGRLLEVEGTVRVLNTARLIDRTDNLEGDVQQLKSDASRNAVAASDAAKVGHTRLVAVLSSLLTFAGGLLLLFIKAKWKL